MFCICILLVLAMFGAAILELTVLTSRASYMGWQKEQANAMAVSGVKAMHAQISFSNGAALNDAPIPWTTVSSDLGGSTVENGSFSARVVNVESSGLAGQTTHVYTVEGSGKAAGVPTTSVVLARFTVTVGSDLGIPVADKAIYANGDVNLLSGAYTSDPTGYERASVASNGSTTVISIPNAIDGTASYYGASSLSGSAKTLDPLSSPLVFPTDTEMTDFYNRSLLLASKPTPSYPAGHVLSGNATYSSSMSISAPMRITGDLTVGNGATLTINVDPSAPKPVIVFVDGSVIVNTGGSIINNGAIIVSGDSMHFQGASDVYRSNDLVNSGLFSFAYDPASAITFNTTPGSASVGTVYAVNGGINLSGGTAFTGSITSRGSGSTTISGGTSLIYSGGNPSFGKSGETSFGTLNKWQIVK